MRNLSLDRATTDRYQEPPLSAFDSSDPYEIDPPKAMQMFTRLGVLLMIALAFGLAAELLVRLPLH